jgi:hypothetical protein
MRLLQSVARNLIFDVRIFALVVLFLAVCTAQGQIAGTGNIQGTVTDATGALILNATVTLTDASTQVTHTAKSDSSGAYAFPNLAIGTYTISIAAPGFETYIKTGNVLEVGSSIAINVNMTVGRSDQKVEVAADSLALQTEDVSFKQTIDQTAVTEMPLNGRQMTGLITLSGGASSAPAGDFTGSKYSYAAISVSIAGGGGNTTSWKLDGGDNNDYMANSNLPFPFPDAVSEFSVESTALGAQSGMHSGGLVNVVTRSGTNTYHGSAFEFIRNNYLDATNFFVLPCVPVAPATHCTTKDTLHQDEYGGTFGGKILKDKLFGFAGYQYHHAQQSSAVTNAYVPTAANLAGDFSITDPAPVASGGTGVSNTCSSVEQLYDPVTGAVLPGNKYPTKPTFNAAALKLLPYLPAVVPLADGSDMCGHVQYAIPSLVNYKQFITRVDYTINAKNNLYAHYFLDGYQSPAPFFPNNILVTTQSGNVERVQSYTVGEAYTISSRLVNSAHFTLSRRVNNRGYNPADINFGTLGVTAFQLVPNGLYQVNTTSGKNHGFTIGGGTNSVSHFNDNAFAFSDDFTMVFGKHQFVFGGEFVRNQLNISNAYETNGIATITGIYSSNGPSGTGSGTGSSATAAAGDANLDFLTGAENSFQQSKQQQNALRGSIPSIYFQDTFHASRKLTIVAGLRWSPEFFPVDYFGRGSIFDMSRFLANQVSTVFPNAPAGTFFYGDQGVSKAFTQNSPWQFAPNVGVSFDPFGDGKTVVRGGMEVAYDEVNFFTGQRVNQNPPFATASNPSTSAQLCYSQPWFIGGTGNGCGQVGAVNTSPYPTPQIPTPATAIFPAQGQYIVLPTQFHPTNVLQYTLSIQHEFGRGWQLQFDYIGNKTHHAPIGLPLNNAIFIPGVWGPNGTGCTGVVTTGPASVFLDKPSVYAAGQPCSSTADQTSRFALAVANPQQGNQYLGGGGGSLLVGDSAIANYNGLVTTVQHRLSSSFSLLANWTWSKCLNEADSQGDLASTAVENPLNPRADYAPCGSDYRHIENIVLVTKSNFAFSNRLEKLAIDGWEFAPLVHIVSGAPFSVTQGADTSLTANGAAIDRANVVQGVPVYLHIANRQGSGQANRAYLNPAAFAVNLVNGTFGNSSRDAYRGLPAYQVDAQISRIFQLHERINLDLRLEAFNALNHPNFNVPTGTTTGSPGGSTGGNASNPASSSFGQISSTSNTARVFQGGVKLTF